MIFVGIMSQALLYLSFALLMGSFLLHIVPRTLRPELYVSKGILILAICGIAIFSFLPVLEVVLYFYQVIGFAQAFKSVLFTFEVGKAWIFTFIVSIIFIITICFNLQRKTFSYIGLLLSFILILSQGWSSHASSIDPIKGFFTHTTHFTAVSIWVGILIVVSWFSKDKANWLDFLRWFTPLAIVCFIGTIVSGIILMSFAFDLSNYTNSWMTPYGQTLLVKHLLIIPLMVYAFINSLLIKKKLEKEINFNPRPWARIESIVILLIFSATAVLGQQAPPHDNLATRETLSRLFTLFYQGQFYPEMTVQLALNSTSLSLIILGILFLILIIFSFIKKAPGLASFLMSLLLVVCIYLALILSIQ